MFPKTIKDISLFEMQKIIDKNPDKSIKAISKLSNLEFKVDKEISKIDRDLILNTFKEDLDDKNFESFIDKSKTKSTNTPFFPYIIKQNINIFFLNRR